MFKSHQWSLRALPFHNAFLSVILAFPTLKFSLMDCEGERLFCPNKIIACFSSFTFIILTYFFFTSHPLSRNVFCSYPYSNNIIAKYLVSFSWLVTWIRWLFIVLPIRLLHSKSGSEQDWRLGVEARSGVGVEERYWSDWILCPDFVPLWSHNVSVIYFHCLFAYHWSRLTQRPETLQKVFFRDCNLRTQPDKYAYSGKVITWVHGASCIPPAPLLGKREERKGEWRERHEEKGSGK